MPSSYISLSRLRDLSGFLQDFGFKRTQFESTIVRYTKGNVEDGIYIGRRSYEIGLAVSFNGSTYSAQELMRLTDPVAADAFRLYAAVTEAGVVAGLGRIRDVLDRCDGKALQGDPEFFALLEERRKFWSLEYALGVLEAQLRSLALQTFRQENYPKVIELCEEILPRLTSAEQRMLGIARARAKIWIGKGKLEEKLRCAVD